MTVLRHEVVAVVECDACPKGWHYESTNVEVEPVKHSCSYDVDEDYAIVTFGPDDDRCVPADADYWKPVNR